MNQWISQESMCDTHSKLETLFVVDFRFKEEILTYYFLLCSLETCCICVFYNSCLKSQQISYQIICLKTKILVEFYINMNSVSVIRFKVLKSYLL